MKDSLIYLAFIEIHGNKSNEIFERAETTSDIQCSTLKEQGIQDIIEVSK